MGWHDDPECPECGESQEDYGGTVSSQDGGEAFLSCSECDAPMVVTTCVTYTFKARRAADCALHELRAAEKALENPKKYLATHSEWWVASLKARIARAKSQLSMLEAAGYKPTEDPGLLAKS